MRTVPIDLSVGTATFPRDGRDAAELLGAADAALYRRKRHRRPAETSPAAVDGGAAASAR